jgi:D-glycerate 3-kinase
MSVSNELGDILQVFLAETGPGSTPSDADLGLDHPPEAQSMNPSGLRLADRLVEQWAASFPPESAWSGVATGGSTGPHRLKQRLVLLAAIAPAFRQICAQRQLDAARLLKPLWEVWLPLALQLDQWRSEQKSPLIVGFLGGQGTGKTTLTELLSLILAQLGRITLSFSLDDFYLPYADRQALQAEDPRLIYRGPPGTHDVPRLERALKQLQRGEFPVLLPRFDKSAHQGAGDRAGFDTVEAADIVLFEGWFVGARPVAPYLFESAPEPIVTAADRTFAEDMNRRLHAYLPLWERLDRLIVLHPSDYRLSQTWRRQAERRMIAQGKPGMDDAAVAAFVTYFWKALHPQLFIDPLVLEPGWVDLVIQINAAHLPDRVERPRPAHA